MLTAHDNKLNPKLQEIWQQFKANYYNNRLAHAILLHASSLAQVDNFSQAMTLAMLCRQHNEPCQSCKSCQLVKQGEHPDLYVIKPKKKGAVIKVEQIRDLSNSLYTAPQFSYNKLILIHNAEKMNNSSANSLLKILEEPPTGVYFILTVASLSTLPATILSRCQRWHLSDVDYDSGNYLAVDHHSAQSITEVTNQFALLIDDLLAINKAHLSIHTVAQKWAAFEFNELMRSLYLLLAQMIHSTLQKDYLKSTIFIKLEELGASLRLVDLFVLLDKVNKITKNLNYSINVNQLLTLEDLLLGFCQQRSLND